MLDATTSDKQSDKRPSVLVVASMWWPLSARLAMAFLRRGFRVSAASHKGHPLRFVDGISRHYRYGGFHALRDLERAIERERPTLVVPCDDGAVWQLHSLHEQVAALRPLLEFSLGPPETYGVLRSRALMLQMAAELGIRTPVTRAVHSQDDLLATGFSLPAVLKLDGTCAGNGVRTVSSCEEAAAAFRELATPTSRLSAWKQLLVDRDPSPLCARRSRQAPSVTVQQFISGRPANSMLACWKGRILGMTIVEVVAARGATGAATVVRVVENAEITAAAHLLVERLQLTGFHGLDFLLEQGTGAAFLIELNPRATQLGHLRLAGRGDLVGALCSALEPDREAGRETLSGDSIEKDIVAFFPQALSSNPDSPYLTSGYHDLPVEQPQLYRELLRKPWPDRRLLARAYHLLRPRKRETEAVFDLTPHGVASKTGAFASTDTNNCTATAATPASYQATRPQ
jgi:predicted ATP-grasp superfamily ATP-dependent carboligase